MVLASKNILLQKFPDLRQDRIQITKKIGSKSAKVSVMILIVLEIVW